MARNRNSESAEQIRSNPVVEELLRSANDEPLVMLQGFPVRSENERIRFYQSMNLTEYIECGTADIVRIEEGCAANEPSVAWIRPSTRLTVVSRASIRAEALVGTGSASPADPAAESVILFAGSTAGSDTPFLSLATQPALANCRITGPIVRMVMKKVSTRWGLVWVPSFQFLGVGVDCSVTP